MDSRLRGNEGELRGNERINAITRLIAVIGLTLALGYIVVLTGALVTGDWLIDAQGRPLASDFVNVYAAGHLAGDGHAPLAYDWVAHKSMEARALGHGFDNYFGWHYPPPFLFVAAALALLPFLAAALLWLAVTLPLYAATVRAIAGTRTSWVIALGFPAVLWNATAGQNGFLTAALFGGTLVLLERRPVLAGICLGLLSYKPHFALLFPFALAAGGYWRTLLSAGAVALAMAASSWLVFGSETWVAFFQWMPTTTQAVLGDGLADWDRLQSVFGFVRARPGLFGGVEMLAWSAQAAVALIVTALVSWLWRRRTPYALKAAALAAGALLVTPYLYMYDLVVLAVAVAFLLRHARDNGFSAGDLASLAAATVLLLIYPYAKTQVGLAAVLIVAAAVMARVAHLSLSEQR
jgi:hypothetical protein